MRKTYLLGRQIVDKCQPLFARAVEDMNKNQSTRRRATPACPKCGMGMRRLYVHMGANRKQRILGVAWCCMNCKTVDWDHSPMQNERTIQQKIKESVKGT